MWFCSNNNGLGQTQQQHNVIYGDQASSLSSGSSAPSSSSMRTPQSTSTTSTTSAVTTKSSSNSKKSTPQFRWRRRKRRSKAQYPEMSRYLLPIDDGEEVIEKLSKKGLLTSWFFSGATFRSHLRMHLVRPQGQKVPLDPTLQSQTQWGDWPRRGPK